MVRFSLILVGLGFLVAMELETQPRAKNDVTAPRPAQSTVGAGNSRDTLTEADRLEMAHVPYAAIAQPISYFDRLPMAPSAATVQQDAPKTADQQHTSSVQTLVVVLPKSRPKRTEAKKAAKADHSKAVTELKSCQENPLRGLLKALNLSHGCET